MIQPKSAAKQFPEYVPEQIRTTVGYGDVYAVSKVGRIITMISSIFGIAIVALPAGIITAGITEQIDNKSDKQTNLTDDEKNLIAEYRSLDEGSKEMLKNIIKNKTQSSHTS